MGARHRARTSPPHCGRRWGHPSIRTPPPPRPFPGWRVRRIQNRATGRPKRETQARTRPTPVAWQGRASVFRAPTTCCARARKSGHGPEKVDRVRTFDFSVQVFRTFFFGRADQTWTFWRPEYLPPISNSATVCNLPHHFMGEGQPLGADTRSVLDRCVKRWTQPGPPNVVGP